MLIPKIAAKTRNITMFELEVAASASSPSSRPIHTVLTEPLRLCSTLPSSTGSENTARVLKIGP